MSSIDIDNIIITRESRVLFFVCSPRLNEILKCINSCRKPWSKSFLCKKYRTIFTNRLGRSDRCMMKREAKNEAWIRLND